MLSRCLFAAALLAGCYRPSVVPCQITCLDSQCPESLVCNGTNQCVGASGDTCPAHVDDAGLPNPDGPVASDAQRCGFRASNVDPCALAADQIATDWTITMNVTVDTTNQTIQSVGGISALPAGALAQTALQLGVGGPEVFVIAVRNFTLQSGTLTVTGNRPLVILANQDATIASTATQVLVRPSNVGACAGAGSNATAAGGGGGGGFGTAGGVGGAGTGPTDTSGGPATGSPTNTPLQPGCRGGIGDADGVAGAGGGALQITAHGVLRCQQSISAPGDGGKASANHTGGGGGGAGGAILLEGTTVMLGPSALLCANGGAGAGAGAMSTAGAIGPCSLSIGAVGGSGDQMGGVGAILMTTGGAGGAGPSGSGGGGGVGRIRINGALSDQSLGQSPQISQGAAP